MTLELLHPLIGCDGAPLLSQLKIIHWLLTVFIIFN